MARVNDQDGKAVRLGMKSDDQMMAEAVVKLPAPSCVSGFVAELEAQEVRAWRKERGMQVWASEKAGDTVRPVGR